MLSRVAEEVERARSIAEQDLIFSVYAQASLAVAGTESFGVENVVGVGVGEKFVGGHPSGELSIAIYVTHKVPPRLLAPDAIVPDEYEGVATDVVEVGELIAQTGRGRFRPAMSGVSVGMKNGGAGTLGFVALKDDRLCIVSNNHVLVSTDSEVGDVISQPGALDGGKLPADEIAQVGGWIDLDFAGGANLVDVAWASIDERDVEPGEIYQFGPFDCRPDRATQDQLVRKSGRTSGMTRGLISDELATVVVRYPGRGAAVLREQLLVTGVDGHPFSESGDSGSLVFDEENRRPLGLLCGGSPKRSIVNRIDNVLTALDVSFAA